MKAIGDRGPGAARAIRPSWTPIEAALKGEHDERVILAGTFAAAMLVERVRSNGSPTRSCARSSANVGEQYLVEIAPGRAGLLSRYAQDPDPGVRADIADILGLSGDPAALPLVEPLIKDQDTQVALAAERAALRLRGSDAHGDR